MSTSALFAVPRGSHLRHVSTGSPSDGARKVDLGEAENNIVEDHESTAIEDTHDPRPNLICSLGVHDGGFAKEDVLLNVACFPPGSVTTGTRMRIVTINIDSPASTFVRPGSGWRSNEPQRQSNARTLKEISLVFVVQEIAPEVISKHPNLEVSISQKIASALGFKHRRQVSVEIVDEKMYSASHVEIAFRDAYLTRADMWRLVVSELADKPVYKGQKILFMGTIKAQVKAIYIQGRKEQSAYFCQATKPIFRCESARYVLYIQMSKEMWDFDTDGTGEIMFHKVINGFLPELFKRWKDINARHLVSVILFTRLEYDRPVKSEFETQKKTTNFSNTFMTTEESSYKDFYRVLVSDMASCNWSVILTLMKKEFKVFLRDVSIRSVPTRINGRGNKADAFEVQVGSVEAIAGRPTTATQGNILEAINLASSQFSGDYIDRDLVRTGLSIVVITPGPGIFEVDYDMLTQTTDTLIENGIGIDLVCLSSMPLHSVPLFKYAKSPSRDQDTREMDSFDTDMEMDRPTNQISRPASTLASTSKYGNLQSFRSRTHLGIDDWKYVIPHWVDVSYWTALSNATGERSSGSLLNHDRSLVSSVQNTFVPRVRMYEVQMMGIMENEMSDISIPYLKHAPSALSDEMVMGNRNRPLKLQLSDSTTYGSLDKELNRKDKLSSVSAASSWARSPSQSIDVPKPGSLLHWMEEHDYWLFRHPRNRRIPETKARRNKSPVSTIRSHLVESEYSHPSSIFIPDNVSKTVVDKNQESHLRSQAPSFPQQSPSRKSSVTSRLPGQQAIQSKQNKLSRHIGSGFRGFGVTALKAIPVIQVSSENAQSASLVSGALRSQSRSQNEPQTQSLDQGAHDYLVPHSSDVIRASKPILINATNRHSSNISSPAPSDDIIDGNPRFFGTTNDELDIDEGSRSGVEASLPRRGTTPWLTMLNPSNPHKFRVDQISRLGRWHHVFPHPVSASNIKWKSLCSPASVPLTTEAFPTPDQLAQEYEENRYTITNGKDDQLSEETKPDNRLLREMISARLCHGYQFVLGSHSSQNGSILSLEEMGIFTREVSNAELIMSKGKTIHQLCSISESVVEVKQFIRRDWTINKPESQHKSIDYKPAIRTALGEKYVLRQFSIDAPREKFDWQKLDTFIGDHGEQHLDQYPDPLHYWRARFVLIPVEHPSNTKRVLRAANEDNDEEIRLEGIHRLTQLWQKQRYVAPNERRFQGPSYRRKDNNPLDIIYQTRNPSAIVAAELGDSLLTENEMNGGKLSQLLPDSELFDRGTLSLASLAKTIQSEGGPKMMDRRWHWRLHYNCFVGLEFTTWLLNNFSDVNTREEAVDLGNELMKGGLFQHVERRHNFRDGNFFYQISNEYRIPRAESRNSWFGSLRSVPSTPTMENWRSSPVDSRSASGLTEETPKEGSATPTGKPALKVALSKRMVYDVDPRKRSYRQELIVLHYDRISSADDCYHLRIDWLGVTPKLIEDTIVSWAISAERYGLRLVEVPVIEASRISEEHPFRAPYLVKLAKQPPERQPESYFDATTLAPRTESRFTYHKALLNKFNFVLDLEAAKDFPRSVDVTYSWGQPDYEYSQYISREGVLLAQITDEGDFLLLANRLYNNRSAAAREANRALKGGTYDLDHRDHRSPARATERRVAASPRGSPTASPLMRATPDVGTDLARSGIVTPEKIAYELEAFCQDSKALEIFYDEVLFRSSTGDMNTPFMEATVPDLGPPPDFNLRDIPKSPCLDAIFIKNVKHTSDSTLVTNSEHI